MVNIEAAERSAGRLVFRNVGVLFFAKNVGHFFPQAYVTCLLFKGTDKVNILDRKDFAGGVVNDIEDSLRFIERNTRTAYRIEGLQREDVPEYPMRALREAITNAVMHRDYFEVGANVFVEIYEDRVEISNPGGLPKGLTRAQLGTRSVRRNPLLADLLHRIAYIEKAGTGIRRMREEARKHKCPAPTFTADEFFTAIFRPTADKVHEVSEETGTKLGLSEDQVQVLVQCRLERSLVEIMAPIQRSNRTKFRDQYIQPLLENGLLEMTVPDKPRSSKQRYRTTPLGLKALGQRQPHQ